MPMNLPSRRYTVIHLLWRKRGRMSQRLDTCVRHDAKTKRKAEDAWRPVICHVAYGDADKHRDIVEQEFRWHQELDLEYVKKHHPDHFSSPHNVARAILVYHYFRQNWLFFEQGGWEYLNWRELPDRPPDGEGEVFKLCVEFPED